MGGVDIDITFRDLQPVDLPAIEWTGSATHLEFVEGLLPKHWAGEEDLLVGELPNGMIVAFGAVNYAAAPDAGELWMLSTHPAWQSLGIGRRLIEALEQRIRQQGAPYAQLNVEHDNPRAASLYRRLGYETFASGIEHWGLDSGQTYVTVVARMRKALD